MIPGYTEWILPLYLGMKFDPFHVFIAATIGSTLGGFFNYGLGYIGSKFVGKRDKIITQSKKWLDKWGDLSVFVTSLIPGIPFDIVAIAVGFLRMNIKIFSISMCLGKVLKHAILIFGINFLIEMFL